MMRMAMTIKNMPAMELAAPTTIINVLSVSVSVTVSASKEGNWVRIGSGSLT